MARTVVTSRQVIVNYPYSLRFDDTANHNISCPYNANYAADIVSAFTILVLAKLNTRSEIADDFYSLVSNNAGINNNNYFLFANSDSQTINCRIADGVSSHLLSSDATYTNDKWNWFGMAYESGVSLDIILNKTIKSAVPTITSIITSQTMRVGVNGVSTSTSMQGNVARVWIMGGRIIQSELDNIVDFGIKPPSLTQALMWDISEGSGISLDDSGPNSNTGTLNGGIAWESTFTPSKSRTIATGRTLATSRTTI